MSPVFRVRRGADLLLGAVLLAGLCSRGRRHALHVRRSTHRYGHLEIVFFVFFICKQLHIDKNMFFQL